MTTISKNLSKDLWESAENLRGQVESSEYKYVVLGLLFLRDADMQHKKYTEEFMEENNYDEEFMEEKEDYIKTKLKDYIGKHGAVYLPDSAKWDNLLNSNSLRKELDEAMENIEEENEEVEGQLPKRYQQTKISNESLKKLMNRFSDLDTKIEDGDSDYIGRVYEFFIKRFSTESGGNGEFYTPEDIVKLLVKSLNPTSGTIFDPCSGSGGMFVQTYKYALSNPNIDEKSLSFKGQELNYSTVKLAKMNMLLHNMSDVNIQSGNSLSQDKYPDEKFDYVITNPPFNYSWSDEKKQISDNDPRFKYGLPNGGDANYAFMQHMLHHTKKGGFVGTVISNGALSNNAGSDIRKNIVKDDLLDVVITLTNNLFYSTSIPVSIFIFSKGKGEYNSEHRNRKNETLFIDASELYNIESRSENRLSNEHINKISELIKKYRTNSNNDIKDLNIDGFCSVVTSDEIENMGYNFNAGRYISYNKNVDYEPLNVQLPELKEELENNFDKNKKLKTKIMKNINKIEENMDINMGDLDE